MTVPLLLGLIWAAVLVPQALRAHALRRADLLVSFDPSPPAAPSPVWPRRPAVTCAQRRRQILAGLLVAITATLLAGLLPPLRVLLVVHLFLVDSFLAYVAVLVHLRRQQDTVSATALGPPRPALAFGPRRPALAFGPRRPAVIREPIVQRARRSLGAVGQGTRMPDLPPLAGAWRD